MQFRRVKSDKFIRLITELMEKSLKVQIAVQENASLTKRELELPEHSSVEDAVRACSLELKEGYALSIFGQRAELTDVLHDGDRLELCAPLEIDPKQARRLRAERTQANSGRRCHAAK